MADAEDRNSAELIIVKGAQLAGALVGGGVGVFGGPVGALLGGAAGIAAGDALAGIGLEVMARMTERGAKRTAAAVLLIGQDTHEHQERGEEPRQDGFFDERGELRPEAHELFEAILLAAANSFEERKLPYLAHLFDGVAYDDSVGAADALFLSRMADQLAYRQLRGLAVFGHHQAHEMTLALAKAAHEDGDRVPDPAFMREFDDLGARWLIGVTRPDDDVPHPPGDLWGGNRLSDFAYAQEHLTDAGELLYRLTRLDQMPGSEQDEWLNELIGDRRVKAS